MKSILVVSGHTDLNNSVANKTILEELSKKLPEAEFDYLDKLYPDFNINVEAEHKKLIKSDIIVLQHPIFWYAMPSLLSRWIEEVFIRGFSHGSTGDKLRGKKLVASFTTGAPEANYHKDASIGYEIEELLPPIKATCKLCGLHFAGFIHTDGVSYHSRSNAEALAAIKEKSTIHAERLIEHLKTL